MERNTRMDKIKSLIPQILVILFTVFIYFYLRLFYQESIFFGFDMPRVALIVKDYINIGSYMTSQSYMQESVWRNVPWGPFLVFFYSLFLSFTNNPLIIANLLTIFNFLGVVLIVYVGWKFFSPTVGVFAGLLLSTNPYWVTYSRIIYQPAPLITFLVLSMLLTLLAIRDKSKFALMLLPISWVILFQIYIPTYAFIIVSVMFLAINYKKINYKYLFIGIVISLVLIIPQVYFYINNPEYVRRFIEAPSLFTAPEKTFIERLIKVLLSFIHIPMGGYFKWQLGYAYQDFVNSFPQSVFFEKFVLTVFVISIITFVINILNKSINKFKLLVFSWTLVVVVSLLVLWVTDLVPRYFLIAIPPAVLLIAIGINDLIIKFKDNKITRIILFSIPILISLYWTTFNIRYDNFVKNYNYPLGKLYDVAETPYIHFKKANDVIKNESIIDGCVKYHVTNDINDVNILWMETDFLSKYVYKNEPLDKIDNDFERCTYYLIYNGSEIENIKDFSILGKSGPYVVLKKLKTE